MLMRKKIKIPIYNTDLLIIKDEPFDKLELEFNLQMEQSYEAITFEFNNQIVVCFNGKVSLNVLVHESVHICNFLYYRIGAVKELHNDEHEAYITAWIVEKIYECINK